MWKAIQHTFSRRSGLPVAFLALIFFVLTTTVHAQPSTFLRMYNRGNTGFAVREVNGNSYVSVGATDYYYNWHWMIMSPILNSNIHFLKTNVNGSLLWERIYNRPSWRTIGTWFEPTQDGGYIITGSANKDVVWPPDSNDVVLIKTDATGNISWAKQFDTGKDELGFGVQQTFDGGYIISGFHDSIPLSLVFNTYVLLIKTNAIGNIQWVQKHGLAVRDLNTAEPFNYVVKQTADSGYVVVGTTASTHPTDIYVLRTDQNGNVTWANSYEHDNSVWRVSTGYDIIESSSGDFIIAASMDKSSPVETNYPFILKISSSGNLLDYHAYESIPPQMFQAGFSSVIQTTDGGFFFTGVGGYSGFGMQAQMLKTDVNFNMQWSRSYTNDGGATMGSRSGRQTSDGGYIFTGKRLNAGSVLLKTNGVGLVPCKNPAVLTEFPASLIVQNKAPVTYSGISAVGILFSTSSPLIDTTEICPVFIPPLPIELMYFSATGEENSVRAEWITSSEVNNDYFLVERSIDNIHFEESGKVSGAGNSNNNLRYEFTDWAPFATAHTGTGLLYYRLKQVDYNGDYSYSAIVPVTFSENGFGILNTINDYAGQSVKVYFHNNQKEQVYYSLADAPGRNLVSGFLNAEDGINIFTIPLSSFSNGVYFLIISNGSEVNSVKLVY